MKSRFLQPQVSTVGLIAHYKLWAGLMVTGKVFDYSLNGNIGTVSGALPKYPGFDFGDSSDHILVAADSTIDIYGKTEYSISVWIYPRSDGGGNLGRMADKGSSNSVGFILFVRDKAAGKMRVRIIVCHDTTNLDMWTGVILPINTWSHIAFVYNEDGGKEGKIYINGVLQSVAATGGDGAVSDDSAEDLYIGNREVSNREFDGFLDDIMFFNKALSAVDAKNDFEITRWRYGV